MSTPLPELSIHVDDTTNIATVRLGSRSKPIVCQCLGQQDIDGCMHFYLDRLIHQEEDYINHTAFGAISTVIAEKK